MVALQQRVGRWGEALLGSSASFGSRDQSLEGSGGITSGGFVGLAGWVESGSHAHVLRGTSLL